MHYATVFDVAHQPFLHWGFFLAGLGGVVIGAAISLTAIFAPKVLFPSSDRRVITLVVGVPFTLASALWTIPSAFQIIQQNNEAISLENGCSTIEGRVENFQPMPYEGHKDESFTVAGVHFSYSDYVVTLGFNNSSSHGGPIREGLPVRICHAGGRILKLEIGT